MPLTTVIIPHATVATQSSYLCPLLQTFCLPSSRGECFGDYCTKTWKCTSLSSCCKVYHASVFLCCKFERDRWSQRGASRQKLHEAGGRVGAILTMVASRGCPSVVGGIVIVMKAILKISMWYNYQSEWISTQRQSMPWQCKDIELQSFYLKTWHPFCNFMWSWMFHIYQSDRAVTTSLCNHSQTLTLI